MFMIIHKKNNRDSMLCIWHGDSSMTDENYGRHRCFNETKNRAMLQHIIDRQNWMREIWPDLIKQK